jgi:hypothetical protein
LANPPKCPDQSRPHPLALITDNGCDRDNVDGVGGVTHPKEKSHREDGEKTNHEFYLACLDYLDRLRRSMA